MKKLLYIILGLTIISCQSNANSENNNTSGHSAEPHCHYNYQHDSTTFTWTAYKTSEKIPVKGTFDSIIVMHKETENLSEFLKNILFEIPVESIFSNNPDRDAKLMNSFFGAMQNTPALTGTVLKVDGDNHKGKIQFEINMNGVTNDFWAAYEYNKGSIDIQGNLYLNDWKAEVAITALNEVCKELHTGADGVSKTWNEVGIHIHTHIKETCH